MNRNRVQRKVYASYKNDVVELGRSKDSRVFLPNTKRPPAPSKCRLCPTSTNHSKPYCPEHIDHMPYALEFAAKQAAGELELKRIVYGGDANIDLTGEVATDILVLLLEKPRTARTLGALLFKDPSTSTRKNLSKNEFLRKKTADQYLRLLGNLVQESRVIGRNQGSVFMWSLTPAGRERAAAA